MNGPTKQLTIDIGDIPPFIVGSNTRHKPLWNNIQKIYTLLSKLLVDKILSTNEISRIHMQIQNVFGIIEDITGDSLIDILVAEHIAYSIDNYFQIALDEQEFRICENIKNFKK